MAVDRDFENAVQAGQLSRLQVMAQTMIAGDEGLRMWVYADTRGIPTIGIGCNMLTSKADFAALGLPYDTVLAGRVPLTLSQVDALFARQLNRSIADVQTLVPDFWGHPTVVQAVLCDMDFQLGEGGLSAFHHVLDAVGRLDYAAAADAMLDSAWAKQTPERAQREAAAMRGAVNG